MSERPPLQWGRILLSAFLAALIALAVILVGLWLLGRNPGNILNEVCPADIATCAERDPTGNIIADIFTVIFTAIVCALAWMAACALLLSLWALVIYFPLAILIAILLIRSQVEERRLAHTVITVLLSAPIAFALLWLVSQIL